MRISASLPVFLITMAHRCTSKPAPKPELKPPRHSFDASNCMTSAERANTRAAVSPARTKRRVVSAGLSPFVIAAVVISGSTRANHHRSIVHPAGGFWRQ
jgi:hypothetical protein